MLPPALGPAGAHALASPWICRDFAELEAGDVFVVINLMPSEVEAGIGRCRSWHSWLESLCETKVFAEYHQDFIATLEVAPILFFAGS